VVYNPKEPAVPTAEMKPIQHPEPEVEPNNEGDRKPQLSGKLYRF
jgi:hypothetical protein